jgi:hypothetical protein
MQRFMRACGNYRDAQLVGQELDCVSSKQKPQTVQTSVSVNVRSNGSGRISSKRAGGNCVAVAG